MSNAGFLVLNTAFMCFWAVWLLGYRAMQRQSTPMTESKALNIFFWLLGSVFFILFAAGVLVGLFTRAC